MNPKQKDAKRSELRIKGVDQLIRHVAARSPGVFSDQLAQETYEALAKFLVDSNPAWRNSAPDREAVDNEVNEIARRVAHGEMDPYEVDELIETRALESASRIAEQVKRHGIEELAEELWTKLGKCPAGTALLYTHTSHKEPTLRELPHTIAACSHGPTVVGAYLNASTAINAAQKYGSRGRRRAGFVCAIAETKGSISDWPNFEKLVQRAAILGHEYEGTEIPIAASGPAGFQHIRHKEETPRDIGGLGMRHIYSICDDEQSELAESHMEAQLVQG